LEQPKQPDLGAMLDKLMEKLKKLECDLNERQEINKRRRSEYHQQRQKIRKHREVICHKCQQSGHFAIECANDPPHALASMNQVCDK